MEKRGPIVLMTDFGSEDYYAGMVKGAIRKENPSVEILDLTHGIRAHSLQNAMYVLHAALPHFPEGTVFLAVVDPGVGTARRGLIARGGRYDLVLPDNGIISPAAEPGMEFHSIDYSLFPGAASTFHGRDVFGPAAARIAAGVHPEKLGPAVQDPVLLPFPDFQETGEGLEAMVYHIDRFGNAVLSVPDKKIDAGRGYGILCPSGRFRAAAARTYADIPDNTAGILPGSSGFAELALDRGSLAERHGLKIEDRIRLTRE